MANSRICRFFVSGNCRLGSDCPYLHDKSSSIDRVCKNYLQGRCSKGSSCEFAHTKPKTRRVIKPLSIVSDKSYNSQGLAASDTKYTKNEDTGYRDKWLDAPEFVPRHKMTVDGATEAVANNVSYADAAKCSVEYIDCIDDEAAALILCPFAQFSSCSDPNCPYLHGLVCDLCGQQCLHPDSPERQQAHRSECLKSYEKEMEYSFAVQRSEGVSCSICMDVVKAKSAKSERRFGILVNCNHPFCITCIRQWRSSTSYENTIIRACPLCRISSPFVIPSEVWIEDVDEKKQLIDDYKAATRQKSCKYFQEGEGKCRFGSHCFYRHAYPDGTIAEAQLRKIKNAEGNVEVVKESTLWDFIDARENAELDYIDIYSSDGEG